MNTESMKLSSKRIMAAYLIIGMVFLVGCAPTMASTQNNNAEKIDEFKLITGITTFEDSETINVLVNTNQQLTYTSVKQFSPPGVVLYFPQTALDKNRIKPEITPENESLDVIKSSELTNNGHTSRIEIALTQDLSFSVNRDTSGIRVSFKKPTRVDKTDSSQAMEVATRDDKSKEIPEVKPITAPEPVATRLESVYAMQSEKGVKIKLLADGTINNYKQFTIDNPARIVFDIYNIEQSQKKEQLIPVKSKWVKNVRHFAYPGKLRVVLDTEKEYLSSYNATPAKNGLLIYVGENVAPEPEPVQTRQALQEKSTDLAAKTVSSTDQKEPAKSKIIETKVQTPVPPPVMIAKTDKSTSGQQPAKSEIIETKILTPVKPPVLIAKSATDKKPPVEIKRIEVEADSEAPAWVNRIDFSSEDAGKSTIIIGTTKPVKYDLKKITDKRLRLKLINVRLPDYRKRPLITTRFESAIDRILPFESPALKNTSLFSIELREAVPYFVEQTDNLIMVHFEASKIPPKPIEKAKLPAWEKVVAETAIVVAEAPKLEKPSGLFAPRPEIAEKYTGEKIALDFYETDIKNVFRILREVSRKNFAIDRGVSGKVTLTLEKPVPWDQVLDLILKMNGLGMTFEGDIIRIAKRSTLDKEEAAIKKKKLAEEKLKQQEKKVKKELEPLLTEYIAINYANASSEVLPKVKPILTKGRGKISVDERNNQLIITDVAEKIDQAREIVRQIDKVTPQVLIEARIVEATNSFTRAMGVQWGIKGGPNQSLSQHLGGDLTYAMAATNPPTSALGLIGINFSRIAGTPFELINAQLSASETQGDLNIISAPKILTLNNKKATIKQGIRYPYNKLVDGETRTEFIDVDLMLEVTPLVTPDGRIAMKIFVSNNEIGAIINNAQSFTTKEATTELLVNDGETVVIGGIRKTTKRNDVSGVPVFKDIPVLGWLFKSTGITDNKEELLIFITPKIVRLKQR